MNSTAIVQHLLVKITSGPLAILCGIWHTCYIHMCQIIKISWLSEEFCDFFCNLLYGLIGHFALLRDVAISFFLSFFLSFYLPLPFISSILSKTTAFLYTLSSQFHVCQPIHTKLSEPFRSHCMLSQRTPINACHYMIRSSWLDEYYVKWLERDIFLSF